MTRQRKPEKWTAKKPHRYYPKRSLSRCILLQLGDRRVMQVSVLATILGETWAELLRTMSRMERMDVLIVEREKHTGRALRCWLTEKGVWYAEEMRRLGFKSDGRI